MLINDVKKYLISTLLVNNSERKHMKQSKKLKKVIWQLKKQDKQRKLKLEKQGLMPYKRQKDLLCLLLMKKKKKLQNLNPKWKENSSEEKQRNPLPTTQHRKTPEGQLVQQWVPEQGRRMLAQDQHLVETLEDQRMEPPEEHMMPHHQNVFSIDQKWEPAALLQDLVAALLIPQNLLAPVRVVLENFSHLKNPIKPQQTALPHVAMNP